MSSKKRKIELGLEGISSRQNKRDTQARENKMTRALCVGGWGDGKKSNLPEYCRPSNTSI